MNRRTVAHASLSLVALLWFAAPRALSGAHASAAAVAPQSTTRQRQQRSRPRTDYARFSHRTPEHRQACDACHAAPTSNWPRVRDDAEAFPDVTDFPDHPSCVGCHRRQFFVGARPTICAVCHALVSPRAGARRPFPNPPENTAATAPRASEFGLNFPHDKHQDVMALWRDEARPSSRELFVHASFAPQEAARRLDSCTICHQTYEPEGDSPEKYVVKPPAALPDGAFWLEKGTFKTTPRDHSSCFNCHWQEGGERPLSSDCAGCHKLLASPPPDAPLALAASTQSSRMAQPATNAAAPTDADPRLAAAMGLRDPLMLAAWLRRQAATFRHEETKHEALGCTSCHINISAAGRLDARTRGVPLLTCGGGGTGCHIKPTIPKKILNIEVEKRRADPSFQCVKCHLNYGREPIPKSHADAVTPAKAK